MQTFVGDEIPRDALGAMCADAYSTFTHPAVVPLVQIGDEHFIEELFHGPTLAFKDVAMQLLGRLFARSAHAARRSGGGLRLL
jgi:threonine synthase